MLRVANRVRLAVTPARVYLLGTLQNFSETSRRDYRKRMMKKATA
jgi:hypothetical protein